MTEEGRTVKSVRLALKVVVQNDGEIFGCSPAEPFGVCPSV